MEFGRILVVSKFQTLIARRILRCVSARLRKERRNENNLKS